MFLIQAADRNVPLDFVGVEVTAQFDPRAGCPEFDDVPIYPQDIHYDVRIASPASDADLAALRAAVGVSVFDGLTLRIAYRNQEGQLA